MKHLVVTFKLSPKIVYQKKKLLIGYYTSVELCRLRSWAEVSVTEQDINQGEVTQDDSQQRFLSTTQRWDIGATLFQNSKHPQIRRNELRT